MEKKRKKISTFKADARRKEYCVRSEAHEKERCKEYCEAQSILREKSRPQSYPY